MCSKISKPHKNQNLNQIANRELLRTVMKAGGFWGIQTEWWHFNRYSRAKAQELFEIVE